MKKIVLLLMIIIASGCAIKEPIRNLAFRDRPVFVTEPQTKDYIELGQVSVNSSGFIWNSCEKIAEDGIDMLLNNSKNMGGNAVIRLQISECQTQYGWFALYFLPGLGPWVRNVHVNGIAIKRTSSSQ